MKKRLYICIVKTTKKTNKSQTIKIYNHEKNRKKDD